MHFIFDHDRDGLITIDIAGNRSGAKSDFLRANQISVRRQVKLCSYQPKLVRIIYNKPDKNKIKIKQLSILD